MNEYNSLMDIKDLKHSENISIGLNHDSIIVNNMTILNEDLDDFKLELVEINSQSKPPWKKIQRIVF